MRAARLLASCLLSVAACGPHDVVGDGGPRDGGADLTASFDLAAGGGDAAVEDLLAPAGDGPAADSAVPCSPAGFATGARLVAAAIDGAHRLALYGFDDSGAWSTLATYSGASYADVTLAPTFLSGSPHIATRAVDDTLAVGPLGCEPVPFASTGARPSFAGSDPVFRGGINNDQRLYFVASDQGATMPAAQASYLSPFAPAGVWVPIDSPAAVFTGTDGNLYLGFLSSAGMGSAEPIAGATSAHAPAVAVVSKPLDLLVVFTGMDTNLYSTLRDPAPADGGVPGWSAPVSLCAGMSGCLIASDQEPVLAAGGGLVAWLGKDGHVYTSTRAADGSWMAPLAASPSETTQLLPAVATGTAKPTPADYELVYVRQTDGALRHVRLAAGQWSTPQTIGATAIAAAPSLIRIQ